MFDNNISRPNITNGAQSAERNTTKKNAKTENTGNASGTGSFSQMLHDFADKVRAAEAAEAKSQKNADSVVDKFIGNLRSADSDTQKKIVERLKGQSLDEILRPDITNGAHSAERNGSGNSVPFYDAFLKAFGNGGAWRQVMDKLEKDGNVEQAQEQPQKQPQEPAASEEKVQEPAEVEEAYEYTYKPGDTFGQVLMKMGLSDGSNLWGPNGDVEYYRKQLHDQGLYGNIPVGATIRLKKRK